MWVNAGKAHSVGSLSPLGPHRGEGTNRVRQSFIDSHELRRLVRTRVDECTQRPPYLTLPYPALAQPGQPLEQRRAVYAPWSPDQLAQRRREYGLIGPG